MDSKKEILELIQGIEDLALDGKLVMADGKVDMSDLKVVTEMFSQRDELIAAFSGLGNIKLSDLQPSDYVEIVEVLVKAGQAVMAKPAA